MKVDIAMGGSTNTILHLLAMAAEAEVDFTMRDMDALSRRIPHLCKLSPANQDYYMEDVHRAGGIMGILGELDRAGLIDGSVGSVAGDTLADVLATWDYLRNPDPDIAHFYSAAPGGKRTIKPYSQDNRWQDLDLNRANGCIRDIDHPYSTEGGLAILHGNIAEDGCVVKTGAVPEGMLNFSGNARVFDQQETALNAIDNGEIEPGSAIVIRYEGPKGGPGMQEMLKPTMSLKAAGLESSCAMITDGRYSGGSSGLAIGHASPEAANQGGIGLIEDGDTIEINIPERRIQLMVSDDELAQRRSAMDQNEWKPTGERTRIVTRALRSYAAFASSADRGGFREVPVDTEVTLFSVSTKKQKRGR